MALNDRLVAFAQAVGVDIGELIITRGDLTTLTTTAKTNLVAAINEIKAGIASVDLTAVINDSAVAGNVTSAYSADKLVVLFDQLKNEILNGAPDSMNTLKEIADYLAANDQNINTLLDLISKTVRYDAAQTLTTAEQLQACVNIGIGNPEIDLVALLNPILLGGNIQVLVGAKDALYAHVIADNSALTFDMSAITGTSPASVPAAIGYNGLALDINSITDLLVTIGDAGSDVYVTDIVIMSGPAGTPIGTFNDALVNNTILIPGTSYNLAFDYTNQDRRVKVTFNVAGNSYSIELNVVGV